MLLHLIHAASSLAIIVSASHAQSDTPAQYAAAVSELADPARIAGYHDLLASEPHLAGTAGDARTIERIEILMRSFALLIDEVDASWALILLWEANTAKPQQNPKHALYRI